MRSCLSWLGSLNGSTKKPQELVIPFLQIPCSTYDIVHPETLVDGTLSSTPEGTLLNVKASVFGFRLWLSLLQRQTQIQRFFLQSCLNP